MALACFFGLMTAAVHTGRLVLSPRSVVESEPGRKGGDDGMAGALPDDRAVVLRLGDQ